MSSREEQKSSREFVGSIKVLISVVSFSHEFFVIITFIIHESQCSLLIPMNFFISLKFLYSRRQIVSQCGCSKRKKNINIYRIVFMTFCVWLLECK